MNQCFSKDYRFQVYSSMNFFRYWNRSSIFPKGGLFPVYFPVSYPCSSISSIFQYIPVSLATLLKPCLSTFQNGLPFVSIRNGCRDMTRRSWHLRARFRKNVWKNPEKLRLIFDGKQLFEPLGGQIGLKIGMYLQFNDI